MASTEAKVAHDRFRAELRALADPDWSPLPPMNDSYGSSGRPCYGVSVPDRRAMARRWVGEQKRAPAEAVLAVVESLLDGESHEERTLATLLLRYSKAARTAARPGDVDRWLDHLSGWAEVDSLCQNVFAADQLLADWPEWRALIERLSTDPNINKRRASVVLLTGPVHYDGDRPPRRPGVRRYRAREGRTPDPDHEGGVLAPARAGRPASRRRHRLHRRQRSHPSQNRHPRSKNQAQNRHEVGEELARRLGSIGPPRTPSAPRNPWRRRPPLACLAILAVES